MNVQQPFLIPWMGLSSQQAAAQVVAQQAAAAQQHQLLRESSSHPEAPGVQSNHGFQIFHIHLKFQVIR